MCVCDTRPAASRRVAPPPAALTLVCVGGWGGGGAEQSGSCRLRPSAQTVQAGSACIAHCHSILLQLHT